MKEDYPKMTATYIVDNKITRSTRMDHTLQWAKKTARDIKRAARRISRLYEFHLDDNDEVYTARRSGNKKKKNPDFRAQDLKYGVAVPRNVKAAKRLDDINGNTFWQDAIDKDIGALKDLECFDFHPHAITR
jgi:hypothetical protein